MKTKFILASASAVFVLFSITLIFQDEILKKISDTLVYKENIEPAEAIVVLSGSGTGNRIEAGVKLFNQGLGEIIVMSGVKLYPGYYQQSLMKSYALKLNIPEDKIFAKEINGENSTWGEAISNMTIMRQKRIKSFILVTSETHSRRAQHVYKNLNEELGYGFKFSVHSSPDPRVPIDSWWKTRTGKKAICLEYLSTLNYFLEHVLF